MDIWFVTGERDVAGTGLQWSKDADINNGTVPVRPKTDPVEDTGYTHDWQVQATLGSAWLVCVLWILLFKVKFLYENSHVMITSTFTGCHRDWSHVFSIFEVIQVSRNLSATFTLCLSHSGMSNLFFHFVSSPVLMVVTQQQKKVCCDNFFYTHFFHKYAECLRFKVFTMAEMVCMFLMLQGDNVLWPFLTFVRFRQIWNVFLRCDYP